MPGRMASERCLHGAISDAGILQLGVFVGVLTHAKAAKCCRREGTASIRRQSIDHEQGKVGAHRFIQRDEARCFRVDRCERRTKSCVRAFIVCPVIEGDTAMLEKASGCVHDFPVVIPFSIVR